MNYTIQSHTGSSKNPQFGNLSFEVADKLKGMAKTKKQLMQVNSLIKRAERNGLHHIEQQDDIIIIRKSNSLAHGEYDYDNYVVSNHASMDDIKRLIVKAEEKTKSALQEAKKAKNERIAVLRNQFNEFSQAVFSKKSTK